jgi:hypothetical protein
VNQGSGAPLSEAPPTTPSRKQICERLQLRTLLSSAENAGKSVSIINIVFRPISVGRVIVSIAIFVFFYREKCCRLLGLVIHELFFFPRRIIFFCWRIYIGLYRRLRRLFFPSSSTSSHLDPLFSNSALKYKFRSNTFFHFKNKPGLSGSDHCALSHGLFSMRQDRD